MENRAELAPQLTSELIMSSAHQHQDNQKRMTNIAIVRLKRGGKKWEIACYRNKAVNWRSGVESDLDEVLQVVTVFENVSRGVQAKTQDLQKHFGTTDQKECCKIILAKGDLQLGDKERQMEYSTLFRDIAAIVAGRCVNTATGWPFTLATIESAMQETIHFSVNPAKAAKLQAMEVIERLKEHLPIARARMHIKLACKAAEGSPSLRSTLSSMLESNDEATSATGSVLPGADEWVVEVLADPSRFRDLEQLTKKFNGVLSILEFSVHADQEADMEHITQLSASASASAPATEIAHEPIVFENPVVPKPSESSELKCLSCGLSFDKDRAAQRLHYKSDLHTYNIKLKATGLPPVSVDEFSAMSEEDKRAVLFDWKTE